MSAANAPAVGGPHDHHGSEPRGQEPSMEEILASIRRIISDDQMLPLTPRANLPPLPPNQGSTPAADRPTLAVRDAARLEEHVAERDAGEHADDPADDHADVLDLAEVAQHARDDRPPSAVDRTEAGPADPHGPPQDAVKQEAAPAAAEAADRAAGEPVGHRPQANHPPESFDAPELAYEPLVSNETMSSVSTHFHQLTATMLMQNFPPVDQIARELLRPMIKTWLDDNLPVMVERLVRAEIERVARVGR